MRNPLPLWSLVAAFVLGALAGPRVAAARPFEVATFPIAADTEASGVRVAVGTDGTMLFAFQSAGSIWSQRFTQAGMPVAAPVAIAVGAEARLSADTRGGYVAAYTRDEPSGRRLYGRRLDATGMPVGAELAIDQSTEDDVALPEVLGIPAGIAFVWQQGDNCWLRRYDADGVALADAFQVGDNSHGFPLAAAALDDGGLIVVWHDPSVHTFLGRTFDPDGSLRFGPTFLTSIGLDVQAVVGTAGGGFAAIGVVLSTTLRLVRFDATFAIVAQSDVASLPPSDTPIGVLAHDAAGRWLVAYATARYDAHHEQVIGHLAPRAQPLAVDLAPLEPSFALSAPSVPRVATALLPSGSFVNAWSTAGAPGSERAYANVVSLCTPDVHICGDGVLDSRCEECDAGAGNSDEVPDACRTSCLLPHCGDGTADAGESCDDGDPSACDGCDADCGVVAGLACGDGILVPGCADQCDDGNTTSGDGCAPQCTLERIPGGGSTRTDCLGEWLVVNPTNAPLLDGHGRMRRVQRCVDDDPRCDFDGGIPGRCTFRIRACAGNTDVAGCVSPSALAGWQLDQPSVQKAARRPELAAVRAAFAPVPAALTVDPAFDLCSPEVEVVVPMRGAAPVFGVGKVALAATATATGGLRDRDALKLICAR